MRPLLKLMEDHELDFHGTFRYLCTFKPRLLASQDETDAFINAVLKLTPGDIQEQAKAARQQEWREWLRLYAERIVKEMDQETSEEEADVERERAMKAVNPRFVLRQWLLEEVIKVVEADQETGKRVLGKVLKVGTLLILGSYVDIR